LQQQEGPSHRLQQSSTLREERDKEREKEGGREGERERERDSHSLGLQQPLDLLLLLPAALEL
jgi:hypothetical protein